MSYSVTLKVWKAEIIGKIKEMDQVPPNEIYTTKVKKKPCCASPIQGASNLEIQVCVFAPQIKIFAAGNI